MGSRSFRIIGLSNSKIQAFNVVLTNESCAYTINVPNMATIKIGPSDNDVLVLLDSDDNIYLVIGLIDTSLYLYRTKTLNPILVSLNVDKPP